ncbi:hypothetical protein [Burkholderia sp. WSM2232]|uniref:hypothetical protein n=1 Tax=Burkholderia sp. WSM2232 TaxID=944436 RepID=UPI0004883785|nr:hypothetical protein [Burkholderia sp. WSM2232]
MKSRVINSLFTRGMRLQRMHSARSIGHSRLVLSGVAGALLLSGCYYPYGYYPAYYPSAYPAYYATVPASAAQREVPLGTATDSSGGPQSGSQSQQSQQSPPVQQAQQAQQAQPLPDAAPQTYVVAQPPVPVYVAPAYPVYYPRPVYPAWYGYGYPGWYGPAVSIGFGWSWGGGGRGRHH